MYHDVQSSDSMAEKVLISFDDETLKRLDTFVDALAFGGTRSAVVDVAVREFLDRQEPPDAKKAQPVRKENRRTVA